MKKCLKGVSYKFLLTRLSRGATCSFVNLFLSDPDFYSHASREAQRFSWNNSFFFIWFLLTRLSRGATHHHLLLFRMFSFLLTRLSRGATLLTVVSAEANTHFYSHASREAQPTDLYSHQTALSDFYSHASREAQQRPKTPSFKPWLISTHTPLARRNLSVILRLIHLSISTHTPLARRNSNI